MPAGSPRGTLPENLARPTRLRVAGYAEEQARRERSSSRLLVSSCVTIPGTRRVRRRLRLGRSVGTRRERTVRRSGAGHFRPTSTANPGLPRQPRGPAGDSSRTRREDRSGSRCETTSRLPLDGMPRTGLTGAASLDLDRAPQTWRVRGVCPGFVPGISAVFEGSAMTGRDARGSLGVRSASRPPRSSNPGGLRAPRGVDDLSPPAGQASTAHLPFVIRASAATPYRTW